MSEGPYIYHQERYELLSSVDRVKEQVGWRVPGISVELSVDDRVRRR